MICILAPSEALWNWTAFIKLNRCIDALTTGLIVGVSADRFCCRTSQPHKNPVSHIVEEKRR